MSATRLRLPAWLQRHGMTGLCLLVVLLATLSLSKQSVDLLRLLRSSPALGTPAATETTLPAQVSLQQLQYLFGTAPRTTDGQGARPTRQQMLLLASFVNPDAQRSAAIIRIAGEQPRRVTVGEQINSSTLLQAVNQDHVVLERNGEKESLYFPALRSPALTAHTPGTPAPGEPTARQLELLQDDDVKALQQRIQFLQQRTQGNGDMPAPEAPEAAQTP